MSHSAEGQMFSMIRQWQVSGISQIEFCKKKSVSYATFHYWYKKFRDSEVSEEVVSSFIPLTVSLAKEMILQPVISGKSIRNKAPKTALAKKV